MSELGERTSIVRALEDGERRWFYGGGLHIWKAKSEETGGAFLLFEDRLDHGKVTPLHIHPDSEETMIVLEGEIVMHLDGVDHTVAAGGIASAPRLVPHAFLVSGADGARLLCLHTPGCCQSFYWDASEPVTEGSDSSSGPLDMDRVRASAQRNGGIEILGPPPFAPGLARCFVSDLDLAGTGGEQLGRTEPAGLKPVACSSCAGRPGMVACLRSSADQPSSNSAIQPDAQVPFS